MKRRDEFLVAIADHWDQHGYGPSTRELKAVTGIGSLNSVDYHLNKLCAQGDAEKAERVARSIHLTLAGAKRVAELREEE